MYSKENIVRKPNVYFPPKGCCRWGDHMIYVQIWLSDPSGLSSTIVVGNLNIMKKREWILQGFPWIHTHTCVPVP